MDEADEEIYHAIVKQVLEAEKLIRLYDLHGIGLLNCHYCFVRYDPANGHRCEEK